jgi:hypothetical protein
MAPHRLRSRASRPAVRQRRGDRGEVVVGGDHGRLPLDAAALDRPGRHQPLDRHPGLGELVQVARGDRDHAEALLVIGRRCHRVAREDAWAHVAGLTVGQDLSERRLQLAGPAPQFSLGKSYPGFAPIGPELVSTDEFTDPGDPELGCRLEGGDVLQKGRTSDMVFDVPELLARLSAVWSVCTQDYAASGAAARLAQLEPVVLFAADGYRWNGRSHDRRAEVAALLAALPTVRVPWPGPPSSAESAAPTEPAQATDQAEPTGRTESAEPAEPTEPADPGAVSWQEATATPAEPVFEPLPFDAPLWVLFSSGTTGTPKGIVHGHGGVLLDHHRLLGLHLDLRPGERFLWYTTTNWMMWNMVVSGLLMGATPVLYDGGPAHPGPGRLWELAAEHRVAVLGVSPGYLTTWAPASRSPPPAAAPAS